LFHEFLPFRALKRISSKKNSHKQKIVRKNRKLLKRKFLAKTSENSWKIKKKSIQKPFEDFVVEYDED